MQAPCRPAHSVSLSPAARRHLAPGPRRRMDRMHRLPLIVPAAAGAKQASVAESLHLLRFADGTPEEEVARVLDGIWSLQYQAAGPICGSAGPLVGFRSASPAGATSAPPSGSTASTAAAAAAQGVDLAAAAVPVVPYTHAVLFRYANEANLARFEAQPRVQLMLGGTGAPEGTGIATLNFRGSVPNELEAIFRRGGEWDAGAELIVAMRLQQAEDGEGGAAASSREQAGEEAAEFLALTQQLAVSSAFGAVQCSYGEAISWQQHCSGSGGGDGGGESSESPAQAAAGEGDGARSAAAGLGPDMVLLVRFLEEEQLRAFLDCPPVAALLEGDPRIPLRALWSGTLLTQPSDSSTQQGLIGGGMRL